MHSRFPAFVRAHCKGSDSMRSCPAYNFGRRSPWRRQARTYPARANDSAIIRTCSIEFPQPWISSHRSSLLTSLSGQKRSDEGPRCKFFNASTAQFGSLSFTLPKKAVPCGAVPRQLTFVKWVSTARHGTARHGNRCVYTDETSGAMSCRAVLTRFFWLV